MTVGYLHVQIYAHTYTNSAHGVSVGLELAKCVNVHHPVSALTVASFALLMNVLGSQSQSHRVTESIWHTASAPFIPSNHDDNRDGYV